MIRLFPAFLLLIFVSFLFSSELKYKQVNPADLPDDAPSSFFVDNEIVVKFDKQIIRQMNLENAQQNGMTGIRQLDELSRSVKVSSLIQKYAHLKPKVYKGREIDPTLWFKVKFSEKIDAQEVVKRFKRLNGVIDAQPIGVHRIYATTNDPSYPDQWHLNQANDADVDAPEAWDVETGSEDVIVAILDTGVRYYHKDLGGANASSSNTEAAQGNMWINEAEKNGVSGVDDDGNGYVDDWIGWDFVDNVTGWTGEDADTPDNDPRDFNGHGTHCSGIVAAINNNGYAVSSPAGGWGESSGQGNGTKIMAMRIGYYGRLFIFEVGYVQMSFAADAFYYAADNGAKIASCSWGSSNSGGLGDAIDYFVASGGLVFKAAGNDDNEASDYMLDRADVIGVASTDQNDVKSDFSTYGTFVDISAPGTSILSTYHDHTDPNNDYIASLSGTSMATPLAASVASMIWAQNPGWTSDQVKQHLFDTSDDIYGISGNSSYSGKLGAGRVNAFNAVQGGGGPVAPTANFSADPASGCVPLAVTFTDQSTGDVDTYSWDFGDGGTSTVQNPTYTYNSAGTYTVSLTVSGPGGNDTETKTDFITVQDGSVTADFSATPLSGDAPLNVTFTDASTGDVDTYSWDFGDGGSSTSQNPSYTYNTAGVYTVSLTVSNACGSDAETKVDYVTVTEPPCDAPIAEFSGTPLSGDSPLQVSFTDNSSNSPTSWSWDFGDGGTATTQNPSHTYNSAGTYTVSLTVTNSCGNDTETKVDYVTVTEPPVGDELHVGTLSAQMNVFFRWSQAQATVQIVDQNGSAVSDATVNGTWSGDFSGSVTLTTDANGNASTTTSWKRGTSLVATFCVDNVSKTGYTYNASANVATCATTDGSTSSAVAADIRIEDFEEEVGFKVIFNSPNPFNPTTTISMLIPEKAELKVEIFNVLGQRVRTLFNEEVEAGLRQLKWDSRDGLGNAVSSGFYFYQITLDNKDRIRKKMLLLK